MQQIRDKRRRLQDRNRELVWDYLRENPCVDCGEADLRVLEFDHRSDKIAGIAEMTMREWSVEKLMAEIEKCDVRCANCHRRRTYEHLGWKLPPEYRSVG